MAKTFIPESEFARAVMDYVENTPGAMLTNAKSGDIPDNWAVFYDGFPSRESCAVNHGLLDMVFDRGAIIPQGWQDFSAQYLSPEADLITRVHTECQGAGLAHFTLEKDERDPFPVTKDFWYNARQEDIYQKILAMFRNKGLLTAPTRRYKNDSEAVGFNSGGKVIDLPGSFRHLEIIMRGMEGGLSYEGDFPQIPKYASIIPVVFMVGDTVPFWDERAGRHKGLLPRQQLLQFVAQHTSPTPKEQSIVYILAEKTGKATIPRVVGVMDAFMLEYAYGSPVGAVFSERTYQIPHKDMNAEELKGLECSRLNWELHQEHVIRYHPWLGLEGYLTLASGN